MKKYAALAVATAVAFSTTTAVHAAPQATAQSSSPSAQAQGSGNQPNGPAEQPEVPETELPPLYNSSTGSSPIDILLVMASLGLVLKLVVDNVEPLRAAVDEAAAQVGLENAAGSSEQARARTGWDFHLPTLPDRLEDLSSHPLLTGSS